MSGYEAPPPSNLDYFNTLFYYDPTGNGSGGGGSTVPSLNYPVAQGLESFPSGIDMGNALVFTNANTTLDRIDNVATINFNDNSSQATAYDAAAVGQLGSANTWQAQNTFRVAPSIPDGITFTGGTQTAPYQSNLVGQLSAANTWASVNTFDAGIKFSDGTTQTTAPVTTDLLTSNNTWSGTNSFTQIPSTTVVTAPTNQQFLTFAYGNSIYPRLLTNNLYSGVNTFDRIAATTCSCADFTSNTLTCTSGIDTPNLTATDTTLSSTLTLNGTTFYGSSGFNNYYAASGYVGSPSVYWTAPDNATAGSFVWNFPYQGNFFYCDGGGIKYVWGGDPTKSFAVTQDDVTIQGTSWNETIATLNYIKNALFRSQIIPPP